MKRANFAEEDFESDIAAIAAALNQSTVRATADDATSTPVDTNPAQRISAEKDSVAKRADRSEVENLQLQLRVAATQAAHFREEAEAARAEAAAATARAEALQVCIHLPIQCCFGRSPWAHCSRKKQFWL